MTKIEVFSDRFVTEKNPNGRGIIDIDTPEGIDIFGGQNAVDKHIRGQKINDEIQKIAEERLIAKGELDA